MDLTKQDKATMLHVDQFPRSSKYDLDWVLKNEMGPNVLWLTEWLCEKMELKPGMRVLDMGCGTAISSIFLAKEFGVQVWANDLWIMATDNWNRIRDAGVGDRVFPIHAEAHALPYADGFFDAAVSLDSYQYYGTDDLYLGTHFAKLVKPGGQMGIVCPALMREPEGGVPADLEQFWTWEWFTFHTADWWKRHWGRTGLVDIELCDTQPDGWELWLRWSEACDAAGVSMHGSDTEFLRADGGRYLGFVRMVARRKP
jgi:cyclopropane fatty-acyl-phospholipid synthase-like methyltransferase